MYYRLKEPLAFRGWKKTPYALQAQWGPMKHKRPIFVDKDTFMDLLGCNGEEDIDPDRISRGGQQAIRELLSQGLMESSAAPMKPLEVWQHYHVFPARYLDGVHWSITGKCNFRCRHCLVSAPSGHHPQLPLEDCLNIVDQIASSGVNSVDITGGEPLVRSDFEQIVEALSCRGIDISLIFTNASLLTGDTLDMLEKYDQHPAFQLSFDGLGHHDWLRGVAGAEKQADAAFHLLRNRKYRASAAMCIHRGNRDCLRDTAQYLAGLNVHALRVNTPQALGTWKEYAEEYALTMDETWDIYREYIPHYFEDGMPLDIELDGFFRCSRGSSDYKVMYAHHASAHTDWDKYPYCESAKYHAYISPEGRLVPCMGFADTVLLERFPSVLEEAMGGLTLDSYYHDVADTRMSAFLKHNPECRSCRHLAACCGGCMVESTTPEGDYMVPDSRSCYFHRHIGEEAVRRVADEAIRRYCAYGAGNVTQP